MADQRVADRASGAAYDVDDPRWHPGLLENTRERERRERRVLVWLEHDGVTRHYRRGDLPREERRRVVPGDDADDNAVRNRSDEELLVRLVGGEHGPYLGALEGGVVVEEARGGGAHLAARLRYGLALLRHDQSGELLPPGPDPVGDRPQHRASLDAGLAGPRLLGRQGGLERPPDVARVTLRGLGDNELVGRVDHRARLFCPLPGAADAHRGLTPEHGSHVQDRAFQRFRLRVR